MPEVGSTAAADFLGGSTGGGSDVCSYDSICCVLHFKYKRPAYVQGGRALGFPHEDIKKSEGETLLPFLRRFHICSAFLVVSLNL